MAASNPPEAIVALLFSQEPRDCRAWTASLSSAYERVRSAFKDVAALDRVPLRILDTVSPNGAGRVAEGRFPIASAPSLQECKSFTDSRAMVEFQAQAGVQVVLQPGDLYSAHSVPGLAVFDMDSTLIQQEVIDELARAVGLYDQVAAITEAAMRGEAPYTDFTASLRARVALLKGVPDSIWEQLKKNVITFTPGAPELIRALRGLGWKTAVLSGGFTPLAYWVKETLGLDYAFANQLASDAALRALTGELIQGAPIVHGEKKRELLLQIAAENDIAIENVIAVGDGSNDLPMMHAAGLGIAFNAKPKVQVAAPMKLTSPSLFDVLYILGQSREDLDHALLPAV